MSGRDITKGATDQSTIVRIIDSTDGTPETGVVAATGGLALSYRREGAAVVALTAANDLATLATAHTDGGLLHIGGGYYRVDPQDAAFASGVGGVLIFGAVTGMVVIGCYHPLVDLNLNSQSAIDLKDFADDGYDPATNKVQGVVLTDTVTTYTGNTLQTGDSFARIGAAGAGLTAIDLPNQTMDITGSITGNLSGTVGSVTGAVGSVTGAVASVTGAVGSVTGNVGGNVTGSVGSVVGAVGSVTGLTAATVHSDLDDIQARIPAALTAGGFIKADVLAISGSTAGADNLEESTEVIGTGTCDAGGTTTAVIASAIDPASAVNDQYNGRVMIFKGNVTAALAGQATTISDYVHATLTFTVVALTTAPASGDLFTIL